MMKHEFEALAGYKVSDHDYNTIIEPMYMATNLQKADFVQTINRKRFEVKELTERQMINRLRKDAKHLFEICGHYSDNHCEQAMRAMAKKIAILNGYDDEDLGWGFWFEKEYEYPNMRGCYFFTALVIYAHGAEVKRINLI